MTLAPSSSTRVLTVCGWALSDRAWLGCLQILVQGEVYDDPHAEFFYKGPDTAEVLFPALLVGPLSAEFGTHKTVRARFGPWLEPDFG